MGKVNYVLTSTDEVANYFLCKSGMTQKKLQKLVYYAYAWFIALHNEKCDEITNILFPEKPEAWVHGPVFPSLYTQYKNFNWDEIPLKEDCKFKNFNSNLISFLDEVWEVFGKMSADRLELMTHNEEPWKRARGNCSRMTPSKNNIDSKIIFNYYNSL